MRSDVVMFLWMVTSNIFWVSGSTLRRTISIFDPIHLSIQELTSVDQLRNILKDELPKEYMREDHFLATWLNRNEFDVEATVQILREYLHVRAGLKLDSVLAEDWTDMQAIFPYSLGETSDKQDRPILYIDIENWDICSYLVEKQSSRFINYLIMLHEESAALLRNLRAEGKNISKYRVIINAAGFNAKKHSCPEHKELICSIASHRSKFDSNSPSDLDKMVMVNVPNIVKTLFPEELNSVRIFLRLYGQNQAQWETVLLKDIDLDQFPEGLLSKSPAQKDNSEGLLMW